MGIVLIALSDFEGGMTCMKYGSSESDWMDETRHQRGSRDLEICLNCWKYTL